MTQKRVSSWVFPCPSYLKKYTHNIGQKIATNLSKIFLKIANFYVFHNSTLSTINGPPPVNTVWFFMELPIAPFGAYLVFGSFDKDTKFMDLAVEYSLCKVESLWASVFEPFVLSFSVFCIHFPLRSTLSIVFLLLIKSILLFSKFWSRLVLLSFSVNMGND